MANGKTTACVLSVLALISAPDPLWASSSAGPYQRIVERNVFDIRMPVQVVPELPPTPMPEIWLNGFTDILGKKQVLLKVRFPPQPPGPLREESYVLTEGEREGDIEILAIDVKAATVRVKIFDTIMNLSLEANGVKVAGAPPDPTTVRSAPPAYTPPMFPPLPARKIPSNTLRLPPG